jgi:hypothetical protein
MNKYIATFYSHFGALTYFKTIKKQGINAKLMPVPRRVSSSCGTCVRFEFTTAIDANDCELECIYQESDGNLECVLEK